MLVGAALIVLSTHIALWVCGWLAEFVGSGPDVGDARTITILSIVIGAVFALPLAPLYAQRLRTKHALHAAAFVMATMLFVIGAGALAVGAVVHWARGAGGGFGPPGIAEMLAYFVGFVCGPIVGFVGAAIVASKGLPDAWSPFPEGSCVNCGYDRDGLASAVPCPECGRAASPASGAVRPPTKTRWLFAAHASAMVFTAWLALTAGLEWLMGQTIHQGVLTSWDPRGWFVLAAGWALALCLAARFAARLHDQAIGPAVVDVVRPLLAFALAGWALRVFAVLGFRGGLPLRTESEFVLMYGLAWLLTPLCARLFCPGSLRTPGDERPTLRKSVLPSLIAGGASGAAWVLIATVAGYLFAGVAGWRITFEGHAQSILESLLVAVVGGVILGLVTLPVFRVTLRHVRTRAAVAILIALVASMSAQRLGHAYSTALSSITTPFAGWASPAAALFPTVFVPLAIGVVAIERARSRVRVWSAYPGHCCQHCGYDRAGLASEAPCPECGTGADR